jgi:hypothetical protein
MSCFACGWQVENTCHLISKETMLQKARKEAGTDEKSAAMQTDSKAANA